MAVREYRNFVLASDKPQADDHGSIQFHIQVFRSPAGETSPEGCTLPEGLALQLKLLEGRQLSIPETIVLGESLAQALLPEQARTLLKSSLDKLKAGQGLRLRLRLAPQLAGLPWEYLYLQPGTGEKDITGFLALDPRISIARHEPLPLPGELDDSPRPRRLLVALADPPGSEDPLDLAQERANIETALEGVPGINPEFLLDATTQSLVDSLLSGADIFHFSGHGVFRQTSKGSDLGTIEGEGAIVLVSDEGDAVLMPAEQLAVNLRGRGVQLVVLGACETGQRDGQNIWSGVVAALMEAGIPAAVAMQYQVWDDSAIAFSRSFYRALAAGLPLDQAVSAGRLAVFNLVHPLREHPKGGMYWRDWGVPVMYLRAEGEFTLPAVVDAQQRQALAERTIVSKEPLSRTTLQEDRPPKPEPRLQEKVGGAEESLTGYSSQVRDLQRSLSRRQLVLFLGADFHPELSGLPHRQGLADRLAQEHGLPPGERLASVAQQVMSHGNRWDFTSMLRQELDTTHRTPGPLYGSLVSVIQTGDVELILTTAQHRMLEVALREAGVPVDVAARDEDMRFANPDRLLLVKLYGDIEQVDTLVVTEQDHNALVRGRDKPELVDEVRRAFRRNTILFLGYDLADPDVSAWFDEVAGDRFQRQAYAVWTGLPVSQVESLASNRGLKVLPVDPLALLKMLASGARLGLQVD